jgi:hypothetical protein
MIIETIFTAFFAVVSAIISVIPTIPVNTSVNNGVSGFFDLIQGASSVVPMTAFFIVFGTILTFYSVKFIISLVNWGIRKIPTIS